MDFLCAILIITISLGLFTQSFETAQKNAAQAKMSINPAEIIAEQILYNCKDHADGGCPNINNYCFRFGNYSSDANAWNYFSTQASAGPACNPLDSNPLVDAGWALKGSISGGCANPACANVFVARRLTSCPCEEYHHSACFLEVKTCG